MPNNERTLPEIWMVQTRSNNGSNLWMVGSESEQQARDMVVRNIGATIIATWPAANASHVAIGELRLTSERTPPLQPTIE